MLKQPLIKIPKTRKDKSIEDEDRFYYNDTSDVQEILNEFNANGSGGFRNCLDSSEESY